MQHEGAEAVRAAVDTVSKLTPPALGGQLVFGYTINEVAAIIGIIVTVTQFSWWLYEKYTTIKENRNVCDK